MSDIRVFRHAHLACGIGAGARGFNMANPRVGNVSARFECAGGIDVDAAAIRNFERLTGVKGTVMDLFSRDQFVAFHGREPAAEWREASPADIWAAFGADVDVCFTSMPCKGFSGLLSQRQSETERYQALNGLTLRAIWLQLEAYKDDPIAIILFENVPRIANRGRWLLDQIIALLRGYGYAVAETVHDCGELGGLAQSRKRFLLVARHMKKVPPFVYQPPKLRLRGVGEVIGKLPLPADPIAGPMHRVPSLQWQTWVRLAFVPAGKDWRALNDLAVTDGHLRDFGIAPELPLRENALGVVGWDETAGVVTSARAPGQGRFSVADPRIQTDREGTGRLGVRDWKEPVGTVGGSRMRPENGAFSVADPRPEYGEATHRNVLGVKEWDKPAATVTGNAKPTSGAHCVADPRINGHAKSVQLGVRRFEDPAPCVKGDMSVGTGPYAVADPRLGDKPRFNNTFRIVRFDEPSPAVAGPGGPAGGQCVADPRMGGKDYEVTKYKVTPYDEPTRAVIAASTTGDGAFAVADPRGGPDPNRLHGKYPVEAWDEASRTVIGGSDNGAFAVADPRPEGFKDGRKHFEGGGHYGVIPWKGPAGTVSASGCYDNGRNSVADPREVEIEADPLPLPSAKDRLVCRIVARDETWHRPFTTLELAALQSIVDPEEAFECVEGVFRPRHGFDLAATSDATKREWIGNAVPSAASKAMAETIGETLLLAGMGETFTLSTREIWVKPLALALAVDTDQLAVRMDGGLA